MIDRIFWWLGLITFVFCTLCGLALLLIGLAGNIIDYIQNCTEFERWKREQEELKDGSTTD